MCTWCTLFHNPSHCKMCIKHIKFGRTLLNGYQLYTFFLALHITKCVLNIFKHGSNIRLKGLDKTADLETDDILYLGLFYIY